MFMATFTVLKFKTEGGAGLVLDKLEKLQKQELIKVLDAAVLVRPIDGQPNTTARV
jgi:uncharacterized membrane protein